MKKGIYVKLSMGKKTRKTKTQKEISSVFNETFVLYLFPFYSLLILILILIDI